MDEALFTKLFPAGVYPIFDPAAVAKFGLSLDQVAGEFRRRNYRTLQIRIKTATIADYLAQLASLPETVWSGFYWISNDYPLTPADLTRLPEEAAKTYTGCHIGWEDLGESTPAEVRRNLAGCSEAINALGLSRPLLGLSTHTEQHIHRIVNSEEFRTPFDYIGYGPYRQTSTKKNTWPVTGAEGLQKTLELTRGSMPVVVIGGLRPDDTPQLQIMAASAGRGRGDVIAAMISSLLTGIKKK